MIDKLIPLASPRVRGPDVVEAQKLLHTNRFKTNFHPGMPDGIYGIKTGHASKRAKYALGYPGSALESPNATSFGKELESYLVPVASKYHQQLPADYKKRRETRLAADNVIGWRVGSVQEAKKHIGYVESPPGSNQTDFNRWYYGANVAAPWCAIFVSYCRYQAGDHNWRYSFVPTILALARADLQRMSTVGSPEQGDLALYDWDRTVHQTTLSSSTVGSRMARASTQ